MKYKTNLLIKAGPGTGKTHTLVEHLISNLLNPERPLELSQVLVVTFTEAAAAEVKQRIRERLYQLAISESIEPRKIAYYLFHLDQAQISTLHSFCYKLIQEYGLEIGLGSNFSILDPAQAFNLRYEIFTNQLNNIYTSMHWTGEEKEAFQNWFLQIHEGSEEGLFYLICKVYDLAQSTYNPHSWLSHKQRLWEEEGVTGFQDLVVEVVQEWWKFWKKVIDELKDVNLKAEELTRVFSHLPPKSLDECLEFCQNIQETDNHWPRGAKTLYRKALRALFDDARWLVSWLQKGISMEESLFVTDIRQMRMMVKSFFKLTNEFFAGYNNYKRQNGTYEFSDLEQFSLELLLGRNRTELTHIAKDLKNRFRMIYVDEYQDINACQDAILCAIAGIHPTQRTMVLSEGPYRFLVGDIKQSIYGFRLTDPRIFYDYNCKWADHKDGLASVYNLSQNHRSKAGILAFINFIFEKLFALAGIPYEKEDQLCPSCDIKSSEVEPPPVQWIVVAPPRSHKLSREQLQELEAKWVVQKIRELVERKFLITDPQNKTLRPIEYKDICIIMRSPQSTMATFLRELENAAIPVSLQMGSIFERPEVVDLISLLELISNPKHDESTLAVLCGPFVGLSVDELLQIRIHHPEGSLWEALTWCIKHDKLSLSSESLQRLNNFYQLFLKWRIAAKYMSTKDLVELIIQQTRYEDYIKAKIGTSPAILESFLDEIIKFEKNYKTNLYAFIAYIHAKQEQPDIQVAQFLNDQSGIRIMSIHQSKGLEFPVVFLVALGKQLNLMDERARILTHVDWGVIPRKIDPLRGTIRHTLLSWAVTRRIRWDRLAEEVRLLYVAMSRARDLLVLSGTVQTDEDTDDENMSITSSEFYRTFVPLRWLIGVTGIKINEGIQRWTYMAKDGSEERFLIQAVSSYPPKIIPPMKEVQKSTIVEEEYLNSILTPYKHNWSTVHPAKITVTEVVQKLGSVFEDNAHLQFVVPTYSSDAFVLENDTEKSQQRGIITHKILQLIDFRKIYNKDEFEKEISRLLNERWINLDELKLVDLEAIYEFVRYIHGDNLLNECSEYYKELPFTAKFMPQELNLMTNLGEANDRDFVIVQGVADLVILVKSGFIVFDYKTDTVDWTLIEKKRLPKYSEQLKLYARALEKVLNRPAICSKLYFIFHRKIITI